MDNISDVNPSETEVIGRCGGIKKLNDHAELTQSNVKKPHQTNAICYIVLGKKTFKANENIIYSRMLLA